jgi:hypothetical protein
MLFVMCCLGIYLNACIEAILPEGGAPIYPA